MKCIKSTWVLLKCHSWYHAMCSFPLVKKQEGQGVHIVLISTSKPYSPLELDFKEISVHNLQKCSQKFYLLNVASADGCRMRSSFLRQRPKILLVLPMKGSSPQVVLPMKLIVCLGVLLNAALPIPKTIVRMCQGKWWYLFISCQKTPILN